MCIINCGVQSSAKEVKKKKENQICENIKLPNRKFNNIYDMINFNNIPSLMFILYRKCYFNIYDMMSYMITSLGLFVSRTSSQAKSLYRLCRDLKM